MAKIYAKEFSEISQTLLINTDLCNSIIKLIDRQPIAGKVTEGGTRLDDFREILNKLVTGETNLPEAYRETEIKIPRLTSIYAGNNKVFPSGWAERLVRTQYSRFYNEAVLMQLIEEEETECMIHHSSEESSSSKCSQFLAGFAHDPHMLYQRLINAYANGVWSSDLKIPDHPHCSHVISPVL